VQFQYNFSMSLSTTGHIRGLKGFITLGSRKDVQMIRRCTVQRLPSRAPRWLSSCSKVSMNHPTLHLLVLVLSSVTCLPPIGIFTDVPTTYWAASWIEQLAAEGITSGCGNGVYCPDSPVTRAQMAVFLVKTFNLP